MSLDTAYRPKTFDDVLGQEATIAILRRFIATGRALHQSYLFAGQYGSGKTTLARIMARALMCVSPTATGDPCDSCQSCKSMLETGASMDFVEVDAATNSGKADMQKITDEIQYSTFAGRRRVYLLDEAHQLSKDALDALLKPLEDNIPGTQDKRLVCLFCTTEPEKMKATIFSRCAPVFTIQPVSPQHIAKRLAYVCDKEGFAYDLDMLQVIAEITECHIRDALKAVEGISMLGPLNRDNVAKYLRLDTNMLYVEVLEQIGKDLSTAVSAVKRALENSSPATCYERLAAMAMLAYQVGLGAVKAPSYMDAGRLDALAKAQQQNLLGFAVKFSSRPGRPTETMLLCDLGSLHYGGNAAVGEGSVVVVQNRQDVQQTHVPTPVAHVLPVQGMMPKATSGRKAEVVTDSRAVRNPDAEPAPAGNNGAAPQMDADTFSIVLAMQVLAYERLNETAGRTDLDRH